MVDRRALVCRRKSSEENSTWNHRTLCNSETPGVQFGDGRCNFNCERVNFTEGLGPPSATARCC